jgi:isopenicillin-N epimerase
MDHCTLDPAILYLNHGSFGACPRQVLEFQSAVRAEIEREPADFFTRKLEPRLAEARAALAPFVGADPKDLAFVANATTGVNSALRSWDLGPGDVVLTTDHTYGACRNALEFIARRRGAAVVVAKVPFPLSDPGEAFDAVMSAVTKETRLALLDHVTSPTALVFPIERLVAALRERGVETIVDGAHAVGQVPLDLDRLGAACYTSNAHKWLCAPKGAAFLHVRRDLHDRIHPLVVSHGFEESGPGRFHAEWDWTGTDDPSAWLSIPECLRFLESLRPGGLAAHMQANHALAVRGRAILLESLGVGSPAPESMLGSMAAIPLPASDAKAPLGRIPCERIPQWTRERGIESWFFPWACAGGKLVRISAQAYNDESQYRALASLLAEGRRAG